MSRIFGAVAQNGYVVRDIHAALNHWINVMGVGPWFLFEKIQLDFFQYRGKDSPLEMTVAMANSGELQIELVQQTNDAPSMYKDFLDAGKEGLQHIAYWTNEYQALCDQLKAKGYQVGQEGQVGGPDGGFTYFDTEQHPGTVIEVSSVSGNKKALFDYIRKASIGWDGKDPIRRF